MSTKRRGGIKVSQLYNDKRISLALSLAAGKGGLDRIIIWPEVGELYWENIRRCCARFGGHAVIAGFRQMDCLMKLDVTRRKAFSGHLTHSGIACLIVTNMMKVPEELRKAGSNRKFSVFSTPVTYMAVFKTVSQYLDENLPGTHSLHGVLMEVYGMGILLTGSSGIGKSECALELIKRGHTFIADDVIGLRRQGPHHIAGFARESIRHLMEIRGLGIIDIKNIFGVGAVKEQTSIELVIRLEEWDYTKEYDRLGMEQKFCEIHRVRLPELIVPVRPGRNLAVVIEVAAMNQKLKNKGIIPAEELDHRLRTMMISAPARRRK